MTSVTQKPTFNSELHIMRALAIIVVGLYHTVGLFPDQAATSFLRPILFAFAMPVFVFIAGFFGTKFFAPAPGKYVPLVVGQLKRLMVPYLFCSAIVVALKSVPALNHLADRPLQSGDILRNVLLYPNSNPMIALWFLYTLFLMQVIFLAISGALRINYRKWTGVGPVALVVVALHASSSYVTPLFGLDRLSYYAIFFFAGGMTAQHYSAVSGSLKKLRYFLLAAGLVLFAQLQMPRWAGAGFFLACIGIVGTYGLSCVLNERWGWMKKALYVVGDYSYAIYLYGYFVRVTLRVGLIHLLGVNDFAIFAAIMVLSFVLPIALAKYVIERSVILRRLALGDWKRAPAPASVPASAPIAPPITVSVPVSVALAMRPAASPTVSAPVAPRTPAPTPASAAVKPRAPFPAGASSQPAGSRAMAGQATT